MSRSFFLSLSLLLGACGDDSMSSDMDADDTTGQPVDCSECPPLMLEADEIPYDNAASMLASTTVQGALDELADPRPLLRLVEESLQSSSSGTQVGVRAECPGEPGNLALALGGACPSAITDANVTLIGTSLEESSFSCEYGKVGDVEVTLVAQVRCQSAPTVE